MSAAVSFELAPGRVHLSVLTNSALSCYRRCPREFQYRYVLRRRPIVTSEALRFGTFFHLGLNAWHATPGAPEAKLEAALVAMRARAEARPEDADPFDLVKAEELMLGYTARWGDDGYDTIAVEETIEAPLVNPATGAASKTYRLAVKLDARVRRDGKTYLLEHKTTSSDIEPGSSYWVKVSALDSQVSTYLAVCKAAGVELDSCVYDVIRKVALRPKLATPPEARRYTKAGLLDARQRETDETPEEFRARVREDISAAPAKYFARGPVVRLEHDEAEHAADAWQTAWFVRESENAGRFPRSPGACERFHTLCDFFDVCSGQASIEDDTRFRVAETPHEELKEV